MSEIGERGVALAEDILRFCKYKIVIVENENELDILLLADKDCALKILSTKLAVYDCNGDQTCNIKKCNACNRSSERTYKSNHKLKRIYQFLEPNYPVAKLEMQIGIFDLFFLKKKFIISYYLNDNTVFRGIFSTKGLYDPGCYPEYSQDFMALDQRREVIFKIDSCLLLKTDVRSPISYPKFLKEKFKHE